MPRKLTNEEWIQKSKQKFKDKFDYSKTKYTGKRNNVTLICPEHGEFIMNAESHIKSVTGCPYCGTKQSNKARSLTQEEYLNKLKEVYGDKYDYSKVDYQGQKRNITLICPKHGEFSHRADGYLYKIGCPKCSKSKNEEIIANFLETNNIKYIPQYRINNPFENRKFIEIDFYLPDYNLFIEYNGKQHYVPIEYFGGKLRFNDQLNRDDNLKKYCKDNNIKLLEIRYDENTEDVIYNYFKKLLI